MKNAFANMMEMFKEADTIMLEKFVDADADMVVGSPMEMATGRVWLGMSLISSAEEAVKSGYPIAVAEGADDLVARITELKAYEPTVKTI